MKKELLYTPISFDSHSLACFGRLEPHHEEDPENLHLRAYIPTHWVNLTPREESILSQHFGKVVFPALTEISSSFGPILQQRATAYVCLNHWMIHKLTDEWFYVRSKHSSHAFYQCDTFEGLMACLHYLIPF